jgi:hypothetical protein
MDKFVVGPIRAFPHVGFSAVYRGRLDSPPDASALLTDFAT